MVLYTREGSKVDYYMGEGCGVPRKMTLIKDSIARTKSMVREFTAGVMV